MNNRQQGFTLIELLVVIAIIAILAATAIPVYERYVFQANCSSSANELSAAKLEVVKNITFGLDICSNVVGDTGAGAEACAAGVITASLVGDGNLACAAILTPTTTANPVPWVPSHAATTVCTPNTTCGFD